MNVEAQVERRVPVTRGALVKRINRRLAHDGEVLRSSRGGRTRFDLGDHYVVDVRMNAIVSTHLDLEAEGRRLWVLKPSERLLEL